MVQEFLEMGLIRPSSSLFSTLTLLVKKAYGSWQFHADCWALNKITIEDKYPIPVIDELLELSGACFFTKLDLCSSYSQIWMNNEDIHKMAFETCEDYYEFVVMLFTLINTPTMFQMLMNDLFWPCVQKNCVGIFDDILYSKLWENHLNHL